MILADMGWGPVKDGSLTHAESNIRAFVADLRVRGHQDIVVERAPEHIAADREGRFCWGIAVDEGQMRQVRMPGLPLDKVRWTGADGQAIYNYPRLYIDGGSWIWLYALNTFTPVGAED